MNLGGVFANGDSTDANLVVNVVSRLCLSPPPYPRSSPTLLPSP